MDYGDSILEKSLLLCNLKLISVQSIERCKQIDLGAAIQCEEPINLNQVLIFDCFSPVIRTMGNSKGSKYTRRRKYTELECE